MTYPVLDMEATGRRIKELRIQNNLSVEDVREYLGFECCQSIYKWQRGESLPLVDNLLILSRLFHTSMDDIIQIREEEDERSSSFYGKPTSYPFFAKSAPVVFSVPAR